MKSKAEIRNAAIAYVVRCHAAAQEWNVTLAELAEIAADYFNDASISIDVIRGICGSRKIAGQTWLHLIRCASGPIRPGLAG